MFCGKSLRFERKSEDTGERIEEGNNEKGKRENPQKNSRTSREVDRYKRRHAGAYTL